ncbi:jg16562, partial [Pararge aegeria aegeria]
ETWTIKAADRQSIDAFEMWCWKRILRQLKITRRLSTTCLKRLLEYFGHIAMETILKRDGDNLVKIVVTGKVEGKRPRGSSPIRCSDQIRTALDTKVHIALSVAKSRVKWHKIVQKVVSGRGHDPQQ